MAENTTWMNDLTACAERGDFDGAWEIVRANRAELKKSVQPGVVRNVLKQATRDARLLSYIDSVEFGVRPLEDSIVRLEKLISFKEGSYVLAKAWGLGKVAKVDSFYRRITVDFKTKPGHQFVYAAAADILTCPPEGHVLLLRESDPTAFETMLKEKPSDFIKLVLKSYGDMTVVKLEDICVQNGFVKSVNWKKFWDGARVELKRDKCVEIPARRADMLRVKEQAESYGNTWLTAFAQETDPKLILASVREFEALHKLETADEATKRQIEERLAFAVTAARKVDDALFARLACQVTKLGFATPTAAEMRDYLWERNRYLKAAVELPAREVGEMIRFLASDDAAKAKLYEALPKFCYTAVCEIVDQFGEDEACRRAIGQLMRQASAPPALTTLFAGAVTPKGGWKYQSWVDDESKGRHLPPFVTILLHAVALGEGRQGGETLRLQNLIRRLFANTTWLETIFKLLTLEERTLLFERFQASIAWDPSMHHTIVVRMTHIAPELEAHIVRVEKKREYARVTSYRSFGLRKQEYLKLINEDMPANIKRIEFAKSYGDLSENAEYQYAKDEQRALMQKQTLMQADLEVVKPSDFADATTDEVMPGVIVVIDAAAGQKTYTILGEWDNDLEKGILSSKTRVAENMLGKKVGDKFELPGAEAGTSEFATIREIKPLTDDIREWMKLPAGVQI